MHAGRTLTGMTSKTESRWSLAYTGNRVMLAVVLGLIAFVPTRSVLLGAIIGGLAFVIATVFVGRPRR